MVVLPFCYLLSICTRNYVAYKFIWVLILRMTNKYFQEVCQEEITRIHPSRSNIIPPKTYLMLNCILNRAPGGGWHPSHIWGVRHLVGDIAIISNIAATKLTGRPMFIHKRLCNKTVKLSKYMLLPLFPE